MPSKEADELAGDVEPRVMPPSVEIQTPPVLETELPAGSSFVSEPELAIESLPSVVKPEALPELLNDELLNLELLKLEKNVIWFG
jgi:hypothetical protein